MRALTVNTVKTFAQSLKMMSLSKELVDTNDFATKRDAYYQSKNWQEAKFTEQPESNTVIDDVEAMFSVHGMSREHLRFVRRMRHGLPHRCADPQADHAGPRTGSADHAGRQRVPLLRRGLRLPRRAPR